MNYHIVTLGCQMNKSDSERVANVIEEMGFTWTDNEEEANLLGVLACSVRQKSIDKVYSKINKWNKLKNRQHLITFVSGCVLPADKDNFLKSFDLVFQMSDLPEFPDMIRQYGVVSPFSQQIQNTKQNVIPVQKKKFHPKPEIDLSQIKLNPIGISRQVTMVSRPEEKIKDFWHVQPAYQSKFEAFVPIQNGCDKFCTFCAVPYTRGREISRPSEEILDEIKTLINKDYKSITLLGQNVNSYGLDKKGNEIRFPELLKQIGEFGKASGKDFWVYFTSPHPRDMSDDVLKVISQYDCLAKQIHLPIQSGDDKVLIKMNRKHTLEDYRKIIHSIRKILPSATIFTDIIVGFTGESDEQFENTRKAMEEFKFNMAYIAKYSPRPGAASSRWTDEIPNPIKTERLHILTGELVKHTLVYNQNLVDKTLKVLVTGQDRKEGYLSAISEGRIVLRFESENTDLIGKFVRVKIHSATHYSLEGALAKEKVVENVES